MTDAMTAPAPPHVTVTEVAAIRDGGRDRVTGERLIRHLSALCPPCWTAVHALPLIAGDARPTSEPLALGLRRLTAPAKSWQLLDPIHRAALGSADRRRPGLLALLLEEIWNVARRSAGDVEAELRSGFEALIRVGGELVTGVEAHDLRCRYYCLVATACCRRGRPRDAAMAIGAAEYHFDRGGCEPEAAAGLLEAQALVAATAGRFERTRALLGQAAELLGRSSPDRRAEALLRLGEAMARTDPWRRRDVATVFREGLEAVNGTGDPSVVLGLSHELARVETADVMWERARGLVGDDEVLRAAATRLYRLEGFYQSVASPLMLAQRAVVRGRILLEHDRAGALGFLREAVAAFEELDARRDAAELVVELLVRCEGKAVFDDGDDLETCLDVWCFPRQREFFYRVVEVVEETAAGFSLTTHTIFLRFLAAVRERTREAKR